MSYEYALRTYVRRGCCWEKSERYKQIDYTCTFTALWSLKVKMH